MTIYCLSNFVFTHGGFRFTDNLLLGVVDNTSNATALSAYPNPIQNNTFCLEYTLPENADITVNLYDLKGQLITNLLNKQTRTKGKNTEQVLLPPGIAKGQYVVELIADQNQIVIKIIVD
ncbi:MAG: T9SS type A sorting domain-containing protein [Sphingobacteriales bacterium JAD_PAG50586_3]|nr:MAG: T9SS type A sorting domain-containing protein [Sphingobacteriales bacterium JAD_PAG50586_3]